MELVALPAFADNYIWMLHDRRQAIVVDPGDAAPVLEALQAQNLSLAAILVTHRHADHIGGLATLAPLCQGPIIGPAHEDIHGLTQKAVEGDRFTLLQHEWTVWDSPGHTSGHIVYLAQPQPGLTNAPSLVWCGDTLFSAGCGRVFDGTPAQLMQSLQRLAALPEDTLLVPTHEYTLSNLAFAQLVDPDNTDVRDAVQHARQLRAAGHPTLPTTVGKERRINPFLRLDTPGVQRSARAHNPLAHTPLDVFTTLRTWKNDFKT